MAHDIWQDSTGKDCMFVVGVRQDAWHLLGQRCDQAVTWLQAMELAGLNWQVIKQQLYARNPRGVTVPVPSYGIFRQSDAAYLGTVGEQFVIKQNHECFAFVDDLLQASGGAHYDSAGALGNGATIWVSARVPAADINLLGIDKHETYLVFNTAHDGSMSHTAFLSSVRVVCRNTLRSALGCNTGIMRIKHTKNQNQRFVDAKRQMEGVVMDAKALQTKLEVLAKRRIKRESFVMVLDKLFPKADDAQASTTRRDNIMATICKLFESNDNDAIPQIRGTAYNMLNAVTEYTDHYRSARITDARAGYSEAQARAENAVVGTGEKLKSSALAVIEEVTANDPVYDPVAFGPSREITAEEFRRMMGNGNVA